MTKQDNSGTSTKETSGLDFGRRNLLKLTGAGVAASMFIVSNAEAQNLSDEYEHADPDLHRGDLAASGPVHPGEKANPKPIAKTVYWRP
jgi:hypothetical protein